MDLRGVLRGHSYRPNSENLYDDWYPTSHPHFCIHLICLGPTAKLDGTEDEKVSVIVDQVIATSSSDSQYRSAVRFKYRFLPRVRPVSKWAKYATPENALSMGRFSKEDGDYKKEMREVRGCLP